ncbi:MAG: hypothetical protein J5J06_07475, partial [Phycisphaerae bacterium]|nr:hypothetical protein [Phycisphaerae bacterium]
MAKRGSSRRGKLKQDEVYGLIPGYDPFENTGGCTFDVRAAQRAVDFFHECLTFTAGEWMGQPFILQPWQQAIVGNLFGWKRGDGRRRYREAFIF